ncbi:hypothetical protein ACLK14_20005 [Escherichia coli]
MRRDRRPDGTLADVSGLRIELPQVEETGCFGAALAARVGTGVYRDFSEAQRDLQHPVRTLLPDMTAHQLYQQKYQRYQHLIAALQGFHARIKEHRSRADHFCNWHSTTHHLKPHSAT